MVLMLAGFSYVSGFHGSAEFHFNRDCLAEHSSHTVFETFVVRLQT